MISRIDIPEKFIPVINMVAVESVEVLSGLYLLLENEHANVQQKKIIELVESVVENKENAPHIAFFLMSLSGVCFSFNEESSEILTLIGKTLEVRDDFDEKHVKAWEERRSIISKIIELPSVYTRTAARLLQADTQTFLSTFSVSVNASPIFFGSDDDLSSITVTSTAKLTYQDNSEDKHLNLSVDKDDLKDIIRVCERALSRFDKLESILGEKFSVIKQDEL